MVKLKSEARPLTRDELGEWGIFISHSSDSAQTAELLCSKLEEKQVPCLWDAQISVGSRNFSDEILTMIRKCIASVLIISRGFMTSQWCNFEVGLLSGLKKNVYIYDPENILSDKNFRFHFDQFCPVFSDMEALTEAVRGEQLFYGLFNNETSEITNAVFREKVDCEVVPVKLKIYVPGLTAVDVNNYRVKALIINMGNFTPVRHTDESICSQTMDDITDDICEVSGGVCCLNSSPLLKENPECVLLNHEWDRTAVSGEEIEMILPLHKSKGTTFKVFFDAENGETADAIFRLLEPYGVNPSVSLSGTQNRVYISLKTSAINGVFRLKDEFSNNFICPGILRL